MSDTESLLLWARDRLAATGWLDSIRECDTALVEAAIEEYQRWWGLDTHGHLDSATMRSLSLPRFCGHPDVMAVEEANGLAKWTKKTVTVGLQGTLPGISAEQMAAAFAEACTLWRAACGLDLRVSPSAASADIVVTVGGIDGRNGTLAWSELPNGSDRRLTQKYDTGEAWVVSATPAPGQIDLVRVCCHELGHAIGLPHLAAGNLLQPTYDTRIRGPQAGDIAEGVRRYGPPVATPGVPPTHPDSPGSDGKPPIRILVYGAEKVEYLISGADRIEIPGYKVTPE